MSLPPPYFRHCCSFYKLAIKNLPSNGKRKERLCITNKVFPTERTKIIKAAFIVDLQINPNLFIWHINSSTLGWKGERKRHGAVVAIQELQTNLKTPLERGLGPD